MSKTAIITGAAKNIGKGIAKGLLDDGYTCFLLDIDKDALHQTVIELNDVSRRCLEYVVDIADMDALDGFIGWLSQKTNSVDVLVHNAGYESDESLHDLTVDEMRKSWAVNQEGAFYLTSAIAKMMKPEKKGNIVFITSTHSQVIRSHPLYSSSKAALEMFMKESALELASSGIRVNAVAPGFVADTNDPEPNKYMPLGYAQQPQDVAECVKFLVSEKARFITGQTLTVDGGFSITHTHYWRNQDKL